MTGVRPLIAFLNSLIIMVLIFLPGIGTSYAAGEVPPLQKGIAQYSQENFEEAVEILQAALEMAPDQARVSFYLGLSYKMLPHYPKAGEYLEKAISLDPTMKDAYLPLAEVLVLLGRLDEAASLLEKADTLNVEPAESGYLRGYIAFLTGKNEAALTAFKQAERGAGPVLRQKIAYSSGQTYLAMAREKEAALQFERSIAAQPGTAMALRSRSALKSIRGSDHKYNLKVSYAFQHDDNVILKPSESVSGLNIAGDESDTRHVFTLQADASLRFARFKMKAYYHFYQSLHSDLDQYDLQGHSLAIVPEEAMGRGKMSPRIAYSHYRLDGETYLTTLTLNPSYTHLLGNGHLTNVSFGVMLKDFAEKPLLLAEDRDALNLSLGASYLLPLQASGGQATARYTFDMEVADGDNWKYRGHHIDLALDYPFREKFNLHLAGSYYKQGYDKSHSFYMTNRDDKIMSLSSELTYKRRRYAVKLQYAYTRADSNIVVYDYKRNVAGIALEAVF